MKRAEQLAWAAVVGLLTVALILLAGGIMYRVTGFWAGMMLAASQAVVAGLGAWGLGLARQAAELNAAPGFSARPEGAAAGGFRMSLGDDAPSAPSRHDEAAEAKTLDTGFQRLMVGISAVVITVLGVVAAYMVYAAYHWAQLNPDQTLPVAGTYAKPRWLDELGLVIGLAGAGIYGVLWRVTRVRRDTEGYGEAVSSGFTLGVGGMGVLAVATVLAYLRVAYASEAAAGVLAALMMLQGLELLVNALRSYSNIEELDQEAVDLQALPFIPMLSSVWLGGMKMLFAQSVGLGGRDRGETGVVGRIMPRALAAIVLIAIGLSCIRVVKPGEVAVLERLGSAAYDPATRRLLPEALLRPGLHLTLPWPVDELVTIPDQSLQLTRVGTPLHAPDGWKNVDFQFWTLRGAKEEGENEDEFITGDPGSSQLLETYVEVRWRVADPAMFYSALSHSEFYEKGSGATRALPIYEAMIQQCTAFAVTRSFAMHSLEQIMISDRAEVEDHTRQLLQDKLSALGSGIEVVYLTIKDLHPPYWRPDQDNAAEPEIGGMRRLRGPASAFEFVVSMREWMHMQVNLAEGEKIAKLNLATGDAKSAIARAEAERSDKVARAQGEAGRLTTMLKDIDPARQRFEMGLLEQQLKFKSLSGSVYDPVNKVIVDPSVKDLQLFQTTNQGLLPMRPPE
jgi:regulator of protease activity HflC (stomatin/prohibitin superfamily)